MASRIVSSAAHFGVTKEGKPVKVFILRDATSGFEARFIELGAAIHSLIVPDSKGKLEDVVLGYDTVSEYEINSTYNGVIVGRTGGRTAFGKFTLNGETYSLSLNCGEHSHHGGVQGISRKLWTGRFLQQTDNSASVQFECDSPHLDDGYPGEAHFRVVYTLTVDEHANATLRVRIETQVSRACPIAPVSHVTFNLNGEKRAFNSPVTNHVVLHHSSRFADGDSGVLNGRFRDVHGILDLRAPRRIAASVTIGGYDHVYANQLDSSHESESENDKASSNTNKLTQVATVSVPENGRRMRVRTNQPATVFYTGFYLDGAHGKGSTTYTKYSGLAVECQNFPNAVNLRAFPGFIDPVLIPGRTFVSETEYEFGIDCTANA